MAESARHPIPYPGHIGQGICPDCGAVVEFERRGCHNCGCPLSWETWDTDCKTKFEGGTFDAQH